MTPGQFAELVNANEVDAVRRALGESPALANARVLGDIGSTPLICAAHRGFPAIVAALLAAGADVQMRELASDTTPLHWAAEGGHPAIARRLVEAGADLEVRDAWYALSPLGWATVVVWAPPFHEDRPATASVLMQAGARLDIFCAIGMSRLDSVRALAAEPEALSRRLGFVAWEMQPLHLAVLLRQTETAALLLDLGADANARTAAGLTALALAQGDAPTADLLRSRGATDDLSVAIVRGDAKAAEALAGRGADGTELKTALLFTAARMGNAPAVALLLRHGADPNARAKHLIRESALRATPLHVAAMHGRVDAARALLDGGAHASPGPPDGTPSPLHLAAGDGHFETVKALLEGGADPNAREGSFGATPLGWAEFGDHAAVVQLLRDQR